LITQIKGGNRLRVFVNKVLRKILGPKRDEVTGEWRRLRNEELCEANSSSDCFPVIISRIMGWARHVALMGKWRGAYWVLVGSPEGKRPPGKLGVDRSNVLKCIFKTSDWEIRTD
jgi:hypothetical protein